MITVHPSAIVDSPASIGDGTQIWHFCHVMTGAVIGQNCVLGQGVFVASSVRIGNHVRIQNNVSVFDGVVIEDYVFLGPSCVLTNVTFPRAEISRKGHYEPTTLRRGATVGANATILPGCTVGRYALIGAGATLTRDCPDYALMKGVPAKQDGWVSRHGAKLPPPNAQRRMVCPVGGMTYQLAPNGVLRCLDLSEDDSLPQERGARS